MAFAPSTYPTTRAARDRWILDRRPARVPVDPHRPHGFFAEDERADSGNVVRTATVFLTNRECPWRCLMCDLWKTTLTETVPIGAIPAQIDFALEKLGWISADRSGSAAHPALASPAAWQIKLYNGGSFFDPRAIPTEEYEAIARRVSQFERVVVECHPAFIGKACLQFRDFLSAATQTSAQTRPPELEVAIGLETVHPETLQKLNKGMTLQQFRRAADFLAEHAIALRVFVLVKPPFLDEAASLHWAERSIDFAADAGATAISLIPTRGGNGALDALQAAGQFSPPRLLTLELAHAYGIKRRGARVFADLWDLERFSECPHCFPQRLARLGRMNLEQQVLEPIRCSKCNPSGCPNPGP